jgi:cellulose synthase/poly-beta-1,6-N-acetylglucosamine synthase-like glycosyltransferase
MLSSLAQQTVMILVVLLLIADLFWLRILLLLGHGIVKWPLVAPRQDKSVSSLAPATEVAVFIPARNEGRYLEAALRSVLNQDYPCFSVRLIDDQSTDDTSTIAEDLAARFERLEVMKGNQRPDGWLGKPWALFQATQGVKADWFLFVDADVVLHPQTLSRAMEKAHQYRADLFSFGVNIELTNFWQRVVGISSALLVSSAAPLVHVNDPSRKTAFAAGGFMLFKRDAYLALGGHEAVKNEIIEDLVLGRKTKEHGLRLILLAAPELVKTHYYGSLKEIWQGIRKSAFAFTDFRPLRLLVFSGLLIVSVLLPWVSLLLALAKPWQSAQLWWPVLTTSLPSVMSMFVLSGAFAVLTHSSFLYGFCLPLGALFFLVNAWDSAWRYRMGAGIDWKGRKIAS